MNTSGSWLKSCNGRTGWVSRYPSRFDDGWEGALSRSARAAQSPTSLIFDTYKRAIESGEVDFRTSGGPTRTVSSWTTAELKQWLDDHQDPGGSSVR
jgi:hypothetical protein